MAFTLLPFGGHTGSTILGRLADLPAEASTRRRPRSISAVTVSPRFAASALASRKRLSLSRTVVRMSQLIARHTYVSTINYTPGGGFAAS